MSFSSSVSPKSTLDFTNHLDDADFGEYRAIKPILKASLGRFTSPKQGSDAYWSETFHCLPSLRLFRSLGEQQKALILASCNQSLMEEAYFIEKTGMTYAAKMVILAENNDQRALYSLFCADEASHFHAIHSFIASPARSYKRQAFLRLLDQIVSHGSFNVLVYMIQVILEGWGLHHYRSLFQNCQNSELKEVFRKILHDEAKHHGSGLSILPRQNWSQQDQMICQDLLAEFMYLVSLGPLTLLQSVEDVLGELEPQDKKQLFEDWGGQARIQSNIDAIKHFVIDHCPDHDLIANLEKKRLFAPSDVKTYMAFKKP